MITVSTRRSPALCGDTDSSYDVAPPRSPEKMMGAPTGAIEGLAGAPVASSPAGPGSGSVVPTARAAAVPTAGVATVPTGPAVAVEAPVPPQCRHDRPCPSEGWSELYVAWSAARNGAATMLEGWSMVVVGCAGVVVGTSRVVAGAPGVSAGPLRPSAAAWTAVVGAGTVVGAGAVVLGAVMPPAAANRVLLAASRSSRM